LIVSVGYVLGAQAVLLPEYNSCPFLADRTNARAYAIQRCVCRRRRLSSSVCLSVTLCIVGLNSAC